MIKNNLKISLRFFFKNSLFTGINVLGLSLALAASFLIAIYVINEMSFDHCHKRWRRIFRVVTHQKYFNYNTSITAFPLALSLKDEFPQIEQLARIAFISDLQLKPDAEFIPVFMPLSADPEIFDIFTIPLTRGTATKNLLADRNSMVISEELAEKLFPGLDPVGKEISGKINNSEQNFIVTGVFKKLPVNSTLQASCLVNIMWSVEAAKNQYEGADPENDWNQCNWITWILLSETSEAGSMDAGMNKMLKKLPTGNLADKFSLQNLTDVYLHSGNSMAIGPTGDIRTIRLFSIIAVLILLVAIANYVILSTAVSMSRAKETGIRKTFGAANTDIRNQVMTESLLMTFLILPLTALLIWLVLPYSWLLFHVPIQIIKSNILVYIPVCLFLIFLTGAIAGIYTSGYLTRLKVLDILKNAMHTGPGKRYVQSMLIVIQLFIFCTLTACTIMVGRQYRFSTRQDTGFYKKDILFIYMNGMKEYGILKEEIKNCPEVTACALATNEIPLRDHFAEFKAGIEKTTDDDQPDDRMTVNYHFLETMGITFLQGRDFSEEFGSDMRDAVILNEKAVKKFNLADPLGKKWRHKTIIGIVKDFNLYSVKYAIPALVIEPGETNLNILAIHYKPGMKDMLLPKLEAAWKRMDPEKQLNYTTIEDEFRYMYADQKRLVLTISICSVIVLLIAASGLFGLTLYISRTRTKETGIKKVLGSTSHKLLLTYVLENLYLVLIATFLSIPVTIYFMNQWLNNFTYRIHITGWIFATTFLIAVIIVISTVIYHSWKASRINPINALRYE